MEIQEDKRTSCAHSCSHVIHGTSLTLHKETPAAAAAHYPMFIEPYRLDFEPKERVY